MEISESRYDRVLLTVIDTPGLDFGEGRELSVERQVTNIIRYIDQQYADTMIEVRRFAYVWMVGGFLMYRRRAKSFGRVKETNIFTCRSHAHRPYLVHLSDRARTDAYSWSIPHPS